MEASATNKTTKRPEHNMAFTLYHLWTHFYPHCRIRKMAGNQSVTFHSVAVLFLLLWLTTVPCMTQTVTQLRPFPPTQNVAKERPIFTIPGDSTCGLPVRNAYCISSTSPSSVTTCTQGFCQQTCGPSSRSALPSYADLIASSAGFSTCVLTDPINVRPGSKPAEYSTSITSGENCFLTPGTTPSAGDNGSFTITAWVWLDQDAQGTLLEKTGASGGRILQVTLAPDGINMTFAAQAGQQTAKLVHPIARQNWTHLAVQVYGRSVSFFINGIGAAYEAAGTVFVDGAISDRSGSFRLGQSANGSAQFTGRIQDVRFYSTTLSNREIQEVYSGTLPPVRVQNSCRCPPATPRIKPQDTLYCISNGVPDNAGDATLRVSEFSHPVEYANDENVNTVWISHFRTEVALEIDLGDQFEVFYVGLEFYSPLPKAVVIERLNPDSNVFQPWQYYAQNCTSYFGMENNGALVAENSVNCIQLGANNVTLPYSKGSITFTVVATDRPGFTNYYNSPVIQQFVQASKVRVRFQDHFNVTNIRHEYFALYELSVSGRCGCNGHAPSCVTDQFPYRCQCTEESHTQGNRCSECQPLYNNKPFRQGGLRTAYNCQFCQCYNHSDSCVYNATLDPFPSSWTEGGGGVCVNCSDNTEGQNCENCIEGYFRPVGKSLSDSDVCSQCQCSPAGSVTAQAVCEKVGGQCPCKVNVTGLGCDRCADGYYNLQATNPRGCTPCECNTIGTVNGNKSCDQTTGQCYCKSNVIGKQCTDCQYGFYNLNEDNPYGCAACGCNPVGSLSMACNPADGLCQCKTNVQGKKCDQCMDGFYNFTSGCLPCNCNATGTEAGTTCDKETGQCVCKSQTSGRQCNKCKPGSISFGNSPDAGCERCLCLEAGVSEGNVDCTAGCNCKANVRGRFCDSCKPNYFNLTKEDVLGCQPCNCDPSGVSNASSCDANTGQCSCLTNRFGRRCDDCVSGFYKSQAVGGGCLQCDCDPMGQMPGTTCDSQSGNCSCRTSDGVAGAKCNQCAPGYYNFKDGTCTACNCLEAGSIGTDCNRITGACNCKQFVIGRRCEICVNGASNLDKDNIYGCSMTPSQQPAPIYDPLSPTSMNISWSPPDFPNGVIQLYRLFRNDTLVYEGPDQSHIDTDLEPYTLYSYKVEAVNSVGKVFSPSITFRTNPGVPSADMVLKVDEIQVASAVFSWNPPSRMNGPLLKYQLVSHNLQNTTDEIVEAEVQVTQAVLTALKPYQKYNLTVRACTAGGCSESEGTIFVTKSAPPTNMQPPNITALSSTQLLVEWNPPLNPNGIILLYELWMRGLPGPNGVRNPPEQRIFNPFGQYDPLNPDQTIMNAPASSYNVTGLQPFTIYQFQVLAQNEAGRAASPWTDGQTQESYPVFMPSPSVIGISGTELNVSWSAPSNSEARGNITIYRLYQNMATNLTVEPFAAPAYWKVIADMDGSVRFHQVTGLTPYAVYDFVVEACTSIGCVNSTASSGRTLPAAPQGMEKPLVDSYNSTVMEVKWKPPLHPNGPTPMYTVQKTNIALSYPASVVRGTRFSGGGYYAFPAETIPQNVDFTGIRFEFRLQKPSGLLMFAATENQQEYIAVLFKYGRPRFMYDTQGQCGAEVEVNITLPENVNLTSLADSQVHTLQVVRQNGGNGSLLVDGIYKGCKGIVGITTFNDEGLAYNDLKWHTFKALRFDGIYANVTVDHKWTGSGYIRDENCMQSTIIGPTTELYVGGVPQDFVLRRNETRNSVLRTVIDQSFQGCIHKVEVLKQMYPFEIWEELQWASAVSYELAFLNWQGCPINLESGIHFMGKGYAAIPRCFDNQCLIQDDAERIQISFKMRTTLYTGLLLMMHGGTGIYVVAYMLNDTLTFEYKDGINKIDVLYTHNNSTKTLCDGEWHHIVFTKIQQQGSISVDGGPIAVTGDPTVVMKVPVLSPVYVGGIKPDSDVSVFLMNNQLSIPTEGFGGCISQLMFGEEAVDISVVRDLVNVNLDGCPPFYRPKETCEASLVADVYQGTDTTAYDYGLLPYTDYIYRVVAENSLGEASSPWGYGRTREGAPVGVGPPKSVRVLSGYIVEVEWNEPQSTSGLLTKTIISAYNMDNPALPPVSEEVLDVNVEAINMTKLTPNTNYRFKISACTSGGCTESVEGTDAHTSIEAPEDVAAPTAVATPNSLLVSWEPPAKPNGNITGYFLYRDGAQIYSGGEREFLVTSLRVYTAYQFHVQACTVAGCNNGPTVILSTAQSPPTEVKAPSLKVLGAKSIEVKWEQPEQLNGMLQRYMLFLSTQEGQQGNVIYNSTAFFLTYTVDNLTADVTYFISVAACTYGGCTVSNSSSAKTEESSPSGIAAPEITSPSSTQLLVTWAVPQFPNGVIISYSLYQNDVIVVEGLVFSYEIGGLLPYSQHTLRLRVCTAQGCGFSEEVQARTQEAPPEGSVRLTASVLNARQVQVYYTQPDKVNGKLMYDVYFEGAFYVDPDNWNYTVVVARRSLLNNTVPFTDVVIGPLVPMSDYNVQVNASNTKGFILSNMVPLTMPQGSPDGMKPPDVVSDTPQSLTVSWQAVGRVNAAQQVAYLLQFRQKEGDVIIDEFGPTTTLSYLKTGLLPYTSYQFRVVASNSFGSTPSTWVTNVTQQDKPSGVYPPRVAAVESRFIILQWKLPASPNGVIIANKLYQNKQLREELSGNITSYTAGELTPYQQYSFQLESCTVAGCTLSDSSPSVRTPEAVPGGIAAPVLKVLTPAMIEIRWSQPLEPNGIISQYIIERKLVNGTDISTVGTFPLSASKSYIDESPQLSPFTTYSYRIKVTNGAGTGEGPWANATTSSSRPAGVNPPVLTVLNSTAIQVTWSEPLQTNGVIEFYVLEWADTRKEIRNFTQLSTVLDNLIPYTNYSVKLAACTSGGCTESVPAIAITLPAIPSGVLPPTATAISQSSISVLWQPPTFPNGPNVRYELARKKIRQPLDSTVTGPGEYQRVYAGTERFFEDRQLTMFTTYVYRITVFNDIGQAISPDSLEVTTFGGFPRRAPVLSAVAVSHQQVFINWTMPDPVELQGDVQMLNLTAVFLQGVINSSPIVGSENFTLDNLLPSTTYNVSLMITIYGGASITSEPVTVTTQDGAPENIPAPVVSVISNTALQVTWIVPAKPNGEITAYNIVINGEVRPTNSSQPGSMVISNLQPYTVYDFKVEACTVFRCSQSDSTFATTAEAPPQGVTTPVLTPYSASVIQVEWKAPTQPNGILLRYELWRKTMQSCSEIPAPEENPEDTKCTYVECSILERMCGSTCYSGAKICCDGAVHDVQNGYECCGTNYLPRPDPQAVCCAGKFYEPQGNFSCCGTRYIQVLPGQVCCPSPIEDRVSVGQGDKCCAGVPYSSEGSQICCGGSLVSAYKSACCGGDVVADSSMCCGNETKGQVYPPQSGYTCCGEVYSATDTSLCCQSDTGHTMVHYYENQLQKTAANEVCCGLEKISAGLSCCNYVGYNPTTQVCADRSTSISGCGKAVVCPIIQTNTAFCDRCDFNSTTTTCGFVPGHVTPPTPTSPPNNGSACSSAPEMIYSGLDLSYSDSSLLPYSQYQYSVRVVNGAGTTASPYSEAQTLEAAPSGVVPPTTRINPEQLYIIYLSWSLPQQPNGNVIRYILLRDGLELYRGMALNYTDDNNVLPYQTYSYMLTACTTAGCTNSPVVKVATAQGVPEDIPAPGVTVMSPTSLQVSIHVPGRPNGEVTQYTVIIKEKVEKYSVKNPQNILWEGLEPYTEYTVYVKVCTVVGCADSPNVTVMTAEGVPQGMDSPSIVVTNATTVMVYWKPPRELNGQLQAYILTQREVGGERQVYNGTDLSTTVDNLIPGRTYDFVVGVTTRGGSTESQPYRIIMPVKTPTEVPPPHTVNVLSATEMQVSWDPVNSSEGAIDQYRVLLNFGQPTEMVTGVMTALTLTLSGLKPYTRYEVRLQACLLGVSNGCGTSDPVFNTTFEAPPTGQSAPKLTALAPNVVKMEWERPTNPNGIITAFRIFQRAAGAPDSEILINQVDGNTSIYTHSGQDLKPFSFYQFGVMAVNSQGQTGVSYASVRTLQAPPTGLGLPSVTSVGAYNFALQWNQPAQPNGIISTYKIYYKPEEVSTAESSVIVSGNVTETVVSGLEPYTKYVVRLEAMNAAGNVTSNELFVSTMQASPSGLQDFSVEKITLGNAVILKWNPPTKPNGIITTYRVYELSDTETVIYRGVARLFEFRRLQPYTEYFVKLEACTVAGCTLGQQQSFFTAEIPPSAQPVPTMGTVTADSVVLRWSPPLSANGKITAYQVYRRSSPLRRKRQATDSGPPGEVVYQTMDTGKPSYEYTDKNVQPHTQYGYKIRAKNSQGFTDSPWQTVQTEQAAPEGVSPPSVSYIDGNVNSLNVTWSPPVHANGVLQSYQIRMNSTIALSLPATRLFYVYEDLVAYTWYSFTLTACSGGGCTTSAPTLIRTKEDAPLFVSPPTLSSVNSTAIQANWSAPQTSNGEITAYRLSMNNAVVYEGMDMSKTVSGLIPYQEYSFFLTACTVGGCTRSVVVTGRPNDAPPADMAPPTLRVVSSSAIEVSWSAPKKPNGIITSYDIRRNGVLLNIDSTSQDGVLRTVYTDYELQAGEEYSYTITAHNRVGSVESPPSQARTYATSPTGLEPPTLTPISSTSIEAKWTPPINPNGQIVNYTLYQGNSVAYSGSKDQLTYTVPGLSFFTAYTFRVQACTVGGCALSLPVTSTTLEAPPQQQDAPTLTALADESGAHQAVRATWRSPMKPNGITLYYQLQRRLVTRSASGDTFGDIVLVHNGTELEWTDSDPTVLPYRLYQYMVTAFNRAGGVNSPWAEVTTKQAPPTSVAPPVIVNTTATTVTVTLTPPQEPNGQIRLYNVLIDGTVQASGLVLRLTAGEATPLSPYTSYEVIAQACTSGGCTNSSSVPAKTAAARPTGLKPVTVVESGVNSTAISLTWEMPTRPNGEIQRFVVLQRLACPPTEQPFTQTCFFGEAKEIFQGLGTSTVAVDLAPYSAYEFLLQVENEVGPADFPQWVRAATSAAAPLYVRAPKLLKNGTLAVIDWTNCFLLNGRLREYLLRVDSALQTRGLDTVFGVQRTSTDGVINFVVEAVTEAGQAFSPTIIFDPNAVDNIGTTDPPVTVAAPVTSKPWYEEIWFIMVIVIVALLITFLIFALCLRRSGPKEPYVRERMPLPPEQHKLPRDLYVIDANDGSIIDTTMSPALSGRSTLYKGPGIGVINPAYDSTLPRLQTLSIDPGSRSSLKGLDDDDIDNITWDKNFDSGLFDDDDVESLNNPAYSFTREQTIFTDTHL